MGIGDVNKNIYSINVVLPKHFILFLSQFFCGLFFPPVYLTMYRVDGLGYNFLCEKGVK